MTTVKLSDPTPAAEVKQRQGPGGRMLDYIDARFVMDRLDAAVGPDNWQDKYEDLPNGSVRCGIGVRVGDQVIGIEWVWKWDVGDPSDIEATKGAHSDAFKRAAVKWGIGRDLYGDHKAPERPRTAAAPRPAPAPVPANDEPPFPGLEAVARQEFDGLLVDESSCPDHGYKWKTNSKGYYCSGKTQGQWCERKPSKAWAAAQEMVA